MSAAYALRLPERAANKDALRIDVVAQARPVIGFGRALVEVSAAAVNPSDAKAALGLMPQAMFPRTPGRDFAGTVIDGPAEWIGRRVWGSGGDIGITRDGSHARYLELPVEALQEMPSTITMDEAGAVGVPFVTATEGFRRSGMPRQGQRVLVMGANGKVGQAAVQLAAQAGAHVLAVQRTPGPYASFACGPVQVIDARACGDAAGLAAAVREAGDGQGIDIVFNTVGSAYFEAANLSMAKRGTQIFISTHDRAVAFDIFAFYRGMHTFVGVDSLALDCITASAQLATLREGFERGTLKPFPVSRAVGLDEALAAYRATLDGSTERIVLHP
jgi:NADPH2:quinone reductase